ncbi:MAG: endonuclease/exonuclease/phosphatase family protein [Patescibacteria group bacterium]
MPARKTRFSLERVVYLLISIGFLITALSAVSSHWWFLELFSHFRIQYVLIGSLLIPILSWRKAFIPALTVLTVTAIHAASIWPYLHTPNVLATVEDQPIRIMFANVYYKQTDFRQLTTVITDYDPDIIVFAEIQEEPFSQLAADFEEQYSFSTHADGIGAYDLSAIAKTEPETVATTYFVPNNPSIYLRFTHQGRDFSILGIHAFSPMNAQYAAQRDENLVKAIEYVGAVSEPSLLVGDFNITQFSPKFDELIADSGMHESQRLFGVQPSWPTHLPSLMRIPIDHILYSDGIVLQNRFLGLPTGSDHLPVIVDISVTDQESAVQ